MITLQKIREQKNEVIAQLAIKNFDATAIIERIIELDELRKSIQSNLNNKQAEMNSLSKEIGILFKNNQIQEANAAKDKTTLLKNEIKTLESQFEITENDLQVEIVKLPNTPHSSVPKGTHAEHNEIVSEHGTIPTLEHKKPHWELAEQYGIVNFELGNKLTGAGFPVYVKQGAKLQRALISFFLDKADEAGYTEYMPPILVNEASGFGTGQLPDKEGQMYHVTGDNLYLIPTAEVPLTNMFRDVILKTTDFPIKCTAYTPCFRREAGSYGKDVRGLNRLHQFDKVEIVRIEHPDTSYAALEEMVAHVKSILEDLELPFRILRLCGGDTGFAAAMTYDFE
ncbi:MAG TPA: serine--tRNA ligase, partial [Bacteroidales bacterium]|nr:serine--tRNA ligase [Bacteroidales bacterium]